MQKLSVLGLGKLGACTAACLARAGYDILGVDINQDYVDKINAAQSPVEEPYLQETISESKDNLKATTEISQAIRETDASLLILPTPSKKDGNFDNSYLEKALTELAKELKDSKKKYHLFIITSTVTPKSCDEVLIPLIEKYSLRKINEGFGLCYNPEFIALGDVMKDTQNPDFVLIGESDKKAGDLNEQIQKNMTDNNPKINRMSLVSAEITKISVNSFVTMKISFANSLASICEKINGSNIDDISKALGNDKRISPYYLRGGISFGGPCFPRDNIAFNKFSGDHGVVTPLASATDEINKIRIQILFKKINNLNLKEKKVGVLGLSYKPNTPVIEESPSIHLIDYLLENSFEINAYDSLAIDNTKKRYGTKINYYNSAIDCIKNTNTIVLCTMEKEFQKLEFNTNNEIIIIDCWRQIDVSILPSNVNYIALGQYN
tara:strand:+ start:899 stop:2206 length:1308 start_codon:yes stop_codon:yes gene_type:complete